MRRLRIKFLAELCSPFAAAIGELQHTKRRFHGTTAPRRIRSREPEVEMKEKVADGAAVARARATARSFGAWDQKGKATTATCGDPIVGSRTTGDVL